MENKTTPAINPAVAPVETDQVFKMLVLIVALLGLLFIASKLINSKQATKKVVVAAPQQAAVQKTNVDFRKTPEKFPVDIPMETGAKITQNYNATSPDGQFQATRVFETKLSLADNYNLYTNFFKTNGWSIKTTADQPTLKMILGEKDSHYLQVTIDQNSITQAKTVNISYIELKNEAATK